MAKNVTCKYRITIYELEAIKAGLTRAGANILRITTTVGPRGLGGQ